MSNPSPEEKPSSGSKSKKNRTVGPFRLERKIGVGGMGIVYQATYLKNGAAVAVKMLSPMVSADEKLLARFEREMSILKKLKHPNIVRYYGGGKHKNQQYYAMELVRGGTLEHELQREKRLHWERVVDIGIQICDALEKCHEQGIIHRDLKPANLFLAKDGTIKLGDFGIARDTQDTALTAAGRTVGTYNYMAPEQIVGKPPVSRKTDIYALGCVLYELLTGRPPFEADNQADLFMMHLQDDPPSLRNMAFECPVWFEKLIMRMLAKEQDDRPYDARATRDALEQVHEKVNEQESVIGATARGGVTVLATKTDQEDARKILAKKKKKKKKKEPFYERAWFYACCLLLLLGAITWMMWPISESKLYAQINTRFKESKELDGDKRLDEWRKLRDEPIKEYLERFPDGPHVDEVQAMRKEIAVEDLRAKLKRWQQVPNFARDHQAVRDYLKAADKEEKREKGAALRLYRAVVSVHSKTEDDETAEIVVMLAREKIDSIKSDILGGTKEDNVKALTKLLKQADEEYLNNQKTKAEIHWQEVVELYGDQTDFEAYVNYAKARLVGRHDARKPWED